MSEVTITPFSFGESDDDILNVVANNLPAATKTEEKSSEEKQEVQKTEKETAKPEKEEQSFFDSLPTEDEEKDKNEDFEDPLNLFDKKKDKKVEEKQEKKITSSDVDYKGLKNFLIENGTWQDFEGSEDLDLDEDTFQRLWEAQAENKAKLFVQEEVAQFGDTASSLIDYLKAGGNVETFLDNHNQQLDIASIDTTEEAGQEKVISTFYESIGKSKDWIKKQINRLKDEGEDSFKEEADDCKAKLKEELDSQREELIQEQRAIQRERQLQVEAFNKNLRSAIYTDAESAEREKKELDKFLFDYKYQDEGGTKYSEFYKKFIEIQQDPKKYHKLVRFVKDFENFEDKKKTEKVVKAKTFNWLRNTQETVANLDGDKTPAKQVEKPKTTLQPFKFN